MQRRSLPVAALVGTLAWLPLAAGAQDDADAASVPAPMAAASTSDRRRAWASTISAAMPPASGPSWKRRRIWRWLGDEEEGRMVSGE